MNPVTREQRDEAIAHFKYEGTLVKDCPYGSGHINDTFLLIFELLSIIISLNTREFTSDTSKLINRGLI